MTHTSNHHLVDCVAVGSKGRMDHNDAQWLANPSWNCALPMLMSPWGYLVMTSSGPLMAGNLTKFGYWWHHLWVPFSQVRSGLGNRP